MASEYDGPHDDAEVAMEEADVYKTTSSSNYVVFRHVRLYWSKFTTFHNIKENVDDNKRWILTPQCDLQPRTALEIKESCTKFVRPRGQWAITTLVKPKAIGTRGEAVKLYLFTLSWPTRWAAKGYTSFTFGFERLDDARHWHTCLSDRLEKMRAEKAAAPAPHHHQHNNSTGALHPRLSQGNSLGATPSTAHTRAPSSSSAAPTQAQVPAPSSFSSIAAILRKNGSMGRKQGGEEQTSQSDTAPALFLQLAKTQVAGLTSSPSPPVERQMRMPTLGADCSLVCDDYGTAVAEAAAATQLQQQQQRHTPSAFDEALAAVAETAVQEEEEGGSRPAAAAPATTTCASVPVPPPPPSSTWSAAGSKPSSHVISALPPHPPPPPPSSDSDSEGPYEDLDAPMMGGPSSGGAVCRQGRGTSRGDVYHSKQRWVPYKQVNGVAIYHRPQTAGDAEAGVGGEFMVSTVVRGRPRRCLNVLTSSCSTTTILGPAILQEVLQHHQAVDGKESPQVNRIVVQAPGLTGVICAPREMIVETVIKTDEAGPTLVLMFNTCEAPARLLESKSGEQQQPSPVEQEQATSVGGRRSWWRRTVSARVAGNYTFAPLKDCTLDNSAEALVTCIIKVDLGGVCGEHSWLRLLSDLAGWTESFLDRMLMAVTLLRDEVEQDRFVAQPLSIMASSSHVKDHRDRDGAGSAADACLGLGLGLGTACRSVDGTVLAAAAGLCRTMGRSGSTPATAAATAVGRQPELRAERSRQEVDYFSSLADGTSVEGIGAGGAGGEGADDSTAVSTVVGMAIGSRSNSATGAGGAGATGLTNEDGGVDGDDERFATERSGTGTGTGAEEPEEWATADGTTSTALAADPRLGSVHQKYDTMEEVLARMRSLSMLDLSVWDNLHQPGKDAPFKIRGPTYLKDRKKIPAGYSRFVLGSMDVIQQPPGVMHEHVARFIPAIRQSGAPFAVVVHLVIPGTPLLGIVATFVTDRHPDTLGTPPAQPMEDDHDWEPFDFVLHKYMHGSTHVRNHCLKLIPHIADGSWMIRQSVGTTPVILGKQLRTIYYVTPQYIEIDIDISANNVASYVTGLVRGATRSLVIDMGFVLEGITPWELPEALLGTLRLYNLDIRTAKLIDVGHEIPLRPSSMAPKGPLGRNTQQTACATATAAPPRPTAEATVAAAATATPIAMELYTAAAGLCSPCTSAGTGVSSNGRMSASGVAGGAVARNSQVASAPSSFASNGGGGGGGLNSRLTGTGGSVGEMGGKRGCGGGGDCSGVNFIDSTTATSTPSDTSSGGALTAGAGTSSRPSSIQQMPLPSRPLPSASISGASLTAGADDPTISATPARY